LAIDTTGNKASAQGTGAIRFKVQIGAFKEEVPVEIASKFIKLSSKGIAHFVTPEGLTIYTVGNFSNVNEANLLRTEVVNSGLPDAFVVAFDAAGAKINLEQAINETK
jgi:hypothetical protein